MWLLNFCDIQEEAVKFKHNIWINKCYLNNLLKLVRSDWIMYALLVTQIVTKPTPQKDSIIKPGKYGMFFSNFNHYVVNVILCFDFSLTMSYTFSMLPYWLCNYFIFGSFMNLIEYVHPFPLVNFNYFSLFEIMYNITMNVFFLIVLINHRIKSQEPGSGSVSLAPDWHCRSVCLKCSTSAHGQQQCFGVGASPCGLKLKKGVL